MIKFDKDVLQTLKTLEKEGFETYAAGDCVRDQIRGIPALDWDLITKASAEDVERLFPNGEMVDKEKKIIRLDFTYEVASKDEEEAPQIEGVILDIHQMAGTVEEDMEKRCFTIDAMADNPDRGFIDPFNGREDIKIKLVRTVSDADKLFKEKPIRMMEAVRLAAETGYDLHKSVYEAIVANYRLLLEKSVTPIRKELERLVVGEYAGKGLNLLASTGLLTAVLGEDVAARMSASDKRTFTELCENIDKTKQVRTRRLGLFYTVFSQKKGLAAVDYLDFDDKTRMHLYDGLKEMINIQFLNDDQTFKKFLFEVGTERFDYIHNLSKAQRIVYDQPSNKIEARNYMLKKIKSGHEPVFVEDLVIDANDLMEAGIADTQERAEYLLTLVVSVVHFDPRNNDRDFLLKKAKKFSKSKFAASTRYIKWLR